MGAMYTLMGAVAIGKKSRGHWQKSRGQWQKKAQTCQWPRESCQCPRRFWQWPRSHEAWWSKLFFSFQIAPNLPPTCGHWQKAVAIGGNFANGCVLFAIARAFFAMAALSVGMLSEWPIGQKAVAIGKKQKTRGWPLPKSKFANG